MRWDPLKSINNSSEGRAQFRRRFHYYGKLRYWDDYYSALDYLDAKSTGLLTISGIMTAVFVVYLSSTSQVPAGLFNEYWQDVIASVGLTCVSVSLLLFLRCFVVLANQLKWKSESSFEELDSLFLGDSFRQREAQIDYALELYARNLIDPTKRSDALKETISSMVRGNDFRLFERVVQDRFNEFRSEVEGEIVARHRYYTFGAIGVLLAFFCSLALALSLIFGSIKSSNDVPCTRALTNNANSSVESCQ